MQKSFKRSIIAILGASFGLPFCCVMGFVILFSLMVATAMDQLPAWAQDDVAEWMLGTPQPVGGTEHYDVATSSSTAGVTNVEW
ncbi:MAG: hypothetical protein U9Q82_06330, partial [Chloroflexota bacterium]|nr:hypothetical protein [Chloroflexota bacterium]